EIETPQLQRIDSVVDVVEPLISIDIISKNISTVNGALAASGETNNVSTYRRTPVNVASSMASYAEGEDLYYNGVMNTGDGYIGVSYRDENFNQIGIDAVESGVYNGVKLNPPVGTKYIAASSYHSEPVI